MKLLLILLLGQCPTEDSTSCVWDAQTQGNMRGQSFISISESLQIDLGDDLGDEF